MANALVQGLRESLRQRLPEYMVPSTFVVLEQWPRLPNGKIDRKGLPRPDGIRWDPKSADLAPQNDTEQRIAGVWQEVLQLERVGSRDNFFDLGGHSLLLIQVRDTLQQLFGRAISTTALLEFPTVAGLAAYLGQAEAGEPAPPQGRARAETRKELARRQSDRRQRNKQT
jgi:acyl carrier protein